MSDMPKEIWAESIDRMHFFETEEDCQGCACDGFLTKYLRADIHEARVTELLENNNALLERARRAEVVLEKIATIPSNSGTTGEQLMRYWTLAWNYLEKIPTPTGNMATDAHKKAIGVPLKEVEG